MKLLVKKASTNVSVYVFIQDSSSTTGAGLAALAWNTASLAASYVRPLAARSALTLATQTVTGAHADGGFVEIDATNLPGVYRFDLPDAVCATGVDSVVVMLLGAANMAPLVLEIQLTDIDVNDGVRAALTALPNAAADAAGGLPISDAGGLDLDALNTAAVRLTAARAQVLDDWVNAGRLDAILDIIAADVVNIDGAAMRGTDSAALASALTTVDTVVDAIKAVTDLLPDAGALTSVATQALLTTVAAYLDTEIASIKAVTDVLPDAGALTTLSADAARLTAARAAVLTDWIDGGRLDLLLDAIPTTAMRGTDNAALASVLGVAVGASISADIAAIQTIATALDTLTKAAGSGDLAAVKTAADAIKVVTDKFTFTIANQVDANAQSINDVAITGDGSTSPYNV